MYTFKRALQILYNGGPIHLAQKVGTFLRYRRPIGPIYCQLDRWKQMHLSSYNSVADPYKKIHVKPSDIKYMSGLEYDIGKIGNIVQGDWDQSRDYFNQYDMFQAFSVHFTDGVPWSETHFYQRVCDQIKNGTMKFGCESVTEFDQRCTRIDELYDSIEQNGYLTGEERSNSDPMQTANRSDYLPTSLDEIKVDIDRNGDFLFVDGRHRLAITKILDLESIPVLVLRRHTEWQNIRETVSEFSHLNRFPEQLSQYDSHPDLRDLQ